MFAPKIEDGRMYGRGTLDMKSFAAVAMNSMHYVLEHKPAVKFGVILSTDEEQGSKSLLRLWRAIRAERRRSA